MRDPGDENYCPRPRCDAQCPACQLDLREPAEPSLRSPLAPPAEDDTERVQRLAWILAAWTHSPRDAALAVLAALDKQ